MACGDWRQNEPRLGSGAVKPPDRSCAAAPEGLLTLSQICKDECEVNEGKEEHVKFVVARTDATIAFEPEEVRAI